MVVIHTNMYIYYDICMCVYGPELDAAALSASDTSSPSREMEPSFTCCFV